MRSPLGITIIIALMLAVDFYLFSVIRSMVGNSQPKFRLPILWGFWILTILTISTLLLFTTSRPELLGQKVRQYMFAVVALLFLSKIVVVLFFLIDDIRRSIQWVGIKVFAAGATTGEDEGIRISRSAFLNWLGVAAGTTMFASVLHGFSNKYNYQVKRVKLHFDNLPKGFLGMKIVQISDIHSGSFDNKKRVERGVDMILREKADLIIFSGDLVNDLAAEMDDYKDVFSRLKAPLGVYSTLGNHDYGVHAHWPVNGLTQEQNLKNLEQIQADMGWNLLNNRHVIIERNGDKFPLIGVENWSAFAYFPTHGDLAKAYAGTESYPFKLLISHDPTHWDAQVRPKFPDIDMMVSGHTHGGQFGVEIPGFQWSPVQYIYKQWNGLYEKGNQKLYVNPGYGFIGYPGRVGVLPEITVFEFV